jgi:hypothetical protein
MHSAGNKITFTTKLKPNMASLLYQSGKIRIDLRIVKRNKKKPEKCGLPPELGAKTKQLRFFVSPKRS